MYDRIDDILDQIYMTVQIVNNLHYQPKDYSSEFSLFTVEAHTLKDIAAQQGVTAKELARQKFKTKSAVSMIVDKLVEKGLVEKRQSAGDRRSYHLYPTAMGLEADALHRAYDETHIRQFVARAGISTGDLEVIDRFFRAFISQYGREESEVEGD